MNLTARATKTVPPWCTIGVAVRARPPTMRRAISGVVRAVDRLTVTVETVSGMLIAVDIEDCRRPAELS